MLSVSNSLGFRKYLLPLNLYWGTCWRSSRRTPHWRSLSLLYCQYQFHRNGRAHLWQLMDRKAEEPESRHESQKFRPITTSPNACNCIVPMILDLIAEGPRRDHTEIYLESIPNSPLTFRPGHRSTIHIIISWPASLYVVLFFRGIPGRQSHGC